MKYYSQNGQDEYILNKYFRNKLHGYFIDIGAEDGIDKSNTYAFEKIGWTGLCVEASPSRFSILRKNRKCHCENVAISAECGEFDFIDIQGYGKGLSGIVKNYDKRHLKRIERETENNSQTISKQVVKVRAIPLQALLDKHNYSEIDYCSIDVEGSELSVLDSIDYSKTRIKVISVEDNYNDQRIRKFLKDRGYILDQRIGMDLIFS
jgi:FkbM family methyltransferase